MTKRLLPNSARASACVSACCSLLPSARAAAGLASDWAEGHNSRARLIAGSGVAGVELQMPEGWKTYWRNPGDAGGVPPSFDWSKSGNLAAAQVLYPAPKRFTDRAGDTVGYKGTVVFPVRLSRRTRPSPSICASRSTTASARRSAFPAEAALSLAIAPGARRATFPPSSPTR